VKSVKFTIFAFAGSVLLFFAAGYFLGSYKTREAIGSEHLAADKYRVVRTPGGMLEVSTLSKQEKISRQTSWTCPLDLCSKLPKTTSEISAEVHYTYRVPLAEYWVLEKISDEPLRYRLKAPKLEPKLPVAVSLSTIRESSNKEIISPSGPVLQKMLPYLGQELANRAVTAPYIQAQNDAAAKTIEEFARKWMSADGERILADAKIEIVF
jgi:hypothetical protein